MSACVFGAFMAKTLPHSLGCSAFRGSRGSCAFNFVRFFAAAPKMGADAPCDQRMLLFSYGTLKTGEPNHHWMTEPREGKCVFIGLGATKNQYPLVIASKYNIPFLLDFKGKGKNVRGEIYEIDKQRLSYLDILESYPKFYTRRLVSIIDPDGKSQNCWTYFLRDPKDFMFDLPFLESYSSKGEHGKEYVLRYKRKIPDYNVHDDVQRWV